MRCRFVWRHRLSGRLRNAVAAASPRLVLSVGDHRLALRQFDLSAGPENPVSHSIGNVCQLVLIETHEPRFGYVEVGIVVRGNRISQHHRLQLCSALDAARNHRVGIDRSRNQAWGGYTSRRACRNALRCDAGFFRDVAMRPEADDRDAERDYERQDVRPANGPKLSTQLSPKRRLYPSECCCNSSASDYLADFSGQLLCVFDFGFRSTNCAFRKCATKFREPN